MLTPTGCLDRQKRLRTKLAEQKIDAAVITDTRDIYYFTGKQFASHFMNPACLVIKTAGGGFLVGPSSDGVTGIEECFAYEVATNATMNMDWMDRLVALAKPKLTAMKGVKRIAWQAQTTPGTVSLAIDQAIHPSESVPLEPVIYKMQRHKDADELDILRQAIKCDHAAYDAAQKFIRPGVTELEVLAEGYRAAQNFAGEKVSHDGDYQCNSMGGPARSRKTQAGEMYVIDAWTLYRGYWCDLCRTYSVDNKPTDVQQSVYDHVAAAHKLITPMFKPGTRGTDIAKATDQHLRQHPALKDTGMQHHAGHGTGIRVHMEPDLNLPREGILEEGDVVCYEPGGYSPEKNVYVRLENSYQITKNGPVNLVEYPFNLVRR